ncbi:hypothetical protein E6O75_ATG00686 [Venturia nashicola]|uniref:Uncharacterized protein n=1 Tax=Venturia nashicola TaxID=86259 RepID=A0A4Z1PP05_9PEZI|nr:hypothetical protein E6O75_ATG00686 [Venturia nashicola]
MGQFFTKPEEAPSRPPSQPPAEDEKDRDNARLKAIVEAQERELWVRDAHIRRLEKDLKHERPHVLPDGSSGEQRLRGDAPSAPPRPWLLPDPEREEKWVVTDTNNNSSSSSIRGTPAAATSATRRATLRPTALAACAAIAANVDTWLSRASSKPVIDIDKSPAMGGVFGVGL